MNAAFGLRATFFAAGFAAAFLTAAFFTAGFLAATFLAATFFTAGALAATFLAATFFAAGFLAVAIWALLMEQINVHNGRSITLLTVKDKEFIENVAKLSQNNVVA
jgi:hypothetical protein